MTTEARPIADETPTGSHHRQPEPPGGRRHVFGEPIRRLFVVTLGLFFVAATLGLVSAHRGVQISLIDEATHADYAYQVAHGHIPAAGAVIAQPILREWACRGTATGNQVQPCNSATFDASKFPAAGQDYNFGHPPLYYAITGVIARGVDSLVGGEHFITFARMTGFLWLFAAMLVLYLAVRRFGVRWSIAAAAAVLLPLCPGVLHASSMVTNDAPAALSGAVALYLLAGVLRTGRIGWIAPAVATLFATATKVLNGLPMLILACVLIVLAVARRRAGDSHAAWRLVLAAAAIGVSFVLVFKGWAIFQSGRGVPNWQSPIAGITGQRYTGSPIDEILSTTFSGFQLVTGYWLQPQLDGETVTLWSRLLNIVIAAAPFLALVTFSRRSPEWSLGLATLGGMLAYPLLVELQVYVDAGDYFPVVTPRYGMTLIPLALGCLAVVANKLRLVRISAAYAIAGTLVMLLAATGVWALGPA
jgi:Dolichyl-phosphate-mannose-protein mannosyltransferase